MIPEPNFHSEGVRRLARAVIIQAGRDALGAGRLTSDDRKEGLDQEILRDNAVFFFYRAAAGRDESCWFHVAELDPEAILSAVLKRLKNENRRWFRERYSRQARN